MKLKIPKAVLPWLACIALALLACFLKFCLLGYGFSALVCIGIICIIVFYTVSKILQNCLIFCPARKAPGSHR